MLIETIGVPIGFESSRYRILKHLGPCNKPSLKLNNFMKRLTIYEIGFPESVIHERVEVNATDSWVGPG